MLAGVAKAQPIATKAIVRNQEISAKLTEAQSALDERKTAKTLKQKDAVGFQHRINIYRTRAVSKERRGLRPHEAEEILKQLDLLIIDIKTYDELQ